ncbi:MAG: hypothetical protein ABI460_03550 [Caldimonas sp.]
MNLISTWPATLVIAAAAAFPRAAVAAPVEGSLMLDGKPVVLSHVLAKLHDNAEGVVGKPLLIAVADRPIPPGALDGLGETLAGRLAIAGKLRGLLFRIDPAKPYEASLIVLDKPEQPGRGLGSVFIGSKEQPAIEGLQIGADRVSARFVRPAGGAQAIEVSFALKVAAPLTREPAITADLAGLAVRASPHYKAALAYAEAMKKGDIAAQSQLTSRAMNEQMAGSPVPAAMTERLKEVGATMKKELARVQRIVERGDRAALLVGTQTWITMVKENGEWKSGD